MSYIVVIRTGSMLSPMHDSSRGPDIIAEYKTEEEANHAAANCLACQVWPWEVVEVNL